MISKILAKFFIKILIKKAIMQIAIRNLKSLKTRNSFGNFFNSDC